MTGCGADGLSTNPEDKRRPVRPPEEERKKAACAAAREDKKNTKREDREKEGVGGPNLCKPDSRNGPGSEPVAQWPVIAEQSRQHGLAGQARSPVTLIVMFPNNLAPCLCCRNTS